MLKTAEDLCGPYVWGRYDLLVLPPSFPYGGMEMEITVLYLKISRHQLWI
jgi:aminopeptidase N